MPNSIERALEAALTDRFRFGQLLVRKTDAGGFVLSHHEDEDRDELKTLRNADEAVEIAKYDAAGNYRPLKTAPNLQHGWRLELTTLEDLKRALDYFYPGRMAVFVAWKAGQLRTTPLRETLDRQSGMYRVAAKISDEQIDKLVAHFCRSDGGCLRTILWKRDQGGAMASTKLPKGKFETTHVQIGQGKHDVPMLCQEACNLLVGQCREVVKNE
jgi:sirohydrochlorin cobaltochelatase